MRVRIPLTPKINNFKHSIMKLEKVNKGLLKTFQELSGKAKSTKVFAENNGVSTVKSAEFTVSDNQLRFNINGNQIFSCSYATFPGCCGAVTISNFVIHTSKFGHFKVEMDVVLAAIFENIPALFEGNYSIALFMDTTTSHCGLALNRAFGEQCTPAVKNCNSSNNIKLWYKNTI